jgi:hypothetical protein
MNNKKKRTLHHIGFAVYEVPPNMTRLTPQYVLDHVSHLLVHAFTVRGLWSRAPQFVLDHVSQLF